MASLWWRSSAAWRPHDRDHSREQRQRGEHGHRVAERRRGIDPERGRQDHQHRQEQSRDHDLRPKARGHHPGGQHQPRQRRTARSAAGDDARGDQGERDQDRAHADPLGVRAPVHATVHVEEVEKREREQRECPPAEPGGGDQQRHAHCAGADHPNGAHTPVGVDHAGAVQLGRTEPGSPLHWEGFGRFGHVLEGRARRSNRCTAPTSVCGSRQSRPRPTSGAVRTAGNFAFHAVLARMGRARLRACRESPHRPSRRSSRAGAARRWRSTIAT